MMFKKIILFIFCILLCCVGLASADIWISDSAVRSGLPDIGSYSAPTVYNDSGTLKLIAGEQDGVFNGYYWSGSAWVSDSSIVSGISSVSAYSNPMVYNDSGTLKLIVGQYDGTFDGYYWSGSAWVQDSSIVSGLTDVGSFSSPAIYNDSGTFKLIAGSSGGTFTGYYWSGSAWVSDSSIVLGLVTTSGGYSTPWVYSINDEFRLITGEHDGLFDGYYWSGSTWVSDSSIVSGLTDVGLYSNPTIFEDEGFKFITGGGGGYWESYVLNQTPNKPTITTPSDSDVILSQPIPITATGTDPEGDLLTYYYYADGTLLGTSDTGTFLWYAYYSGHYDLTVRTHDGYSFSEYSDAVNIDVVIPPTDPYDDNIMENLSGWWKLDDDFVDSSGNGNNGTNYGSTFVDGYIYNTSSFDGSSYISILDDSTLESQTITLSMWINPDSISTCGIIEKSRVDSYAMLLTGDADFRIANNNLGSGTNLVIGEWAHLVGTYNGTTMCIYVNGELKNTKSVETALNYSTETLTIGNLHGSYGFDGKIDDVKIYNTSLSAEQVKYLYNLRTVEPEPSSTQSFVYPPLLHDVALDFPESSDAYKYQVARDAAFNLIAAEGYVSTNETTVSLSADDYWWRVYGYNETLDQLSNSSSVWQFTIEDTGGGGIQTAIAGVVYSSENGASTELTGAVVSIWNNTWSSQMITGENGYYLFDNLGNGTYSIQATKADYSDSQIQYVTTVYDETVMRDILMEEREDESQYYSPHKVKFIVQTLWGTKYPNVAVKVYEGDAVAYTYSESTGADGSATFKLNEEQEYRITFVNSTLGIDVNKILFPKDTEYKIIVFPTNIIPDDRDQDDILFGAYGQSINLTHGYINVSFNDTSGTTTLAQMWIKDTNLTTLYSFSTTNSSADWSQVVDGGNATYIVEFNLDNTVLSDTLEITRTIKFNDLVNFDLGFDEGWKYIFVSCVILVLLFLLATKLNAEIMAGIVVIAAWFLTFLGWTTAGLTSAQSITVGLMLMLGTILAFGAIIRKGEDSQ